MSASQTIQPHITVLSEEQIERIHDHSLHLLSTVGVRVDSEQARRLFARAKATVSPDDRRVRIPAELVEWALESAPSSIAVFRRDGRPAFRLGFDVSAQPNGENQTRFGIGVTALYYQDPQTDAVVPFARKHMEVTVRLGNSLPSFDAVSTVGIVQDVAPELSDLYGVLEMTANTVKPLVILVSDEKRFPDVLDLLEHLHGDLASRPFIIPYFNPISPLVLNQGTADKMLVSIERGLPIIYSNWHGWRPRRSPPPEPSGDECSYCGLTFSQLVRGLSGDLGSLPASLT
jgi:trimethylamine--corrinoid protein Co-methyltransferase